MSIVSGIATAPGVSSLLNAPRDVNADLRASAQEQQQVAEIKRADAARRVPENRGADRPLLRDLDAESGQRAPARSSNGDSRYERFVQAVQALRGDFETLRIPDSKIAIMKASADEVFMLGDGVPGDVPKPVIGELKLVTPPAPTETPDGALSSADARPAAVQRQEPLEVTIPGSGFANEADAPASGADETPPAEPVFVELAGGAAAASTAPETPKAPEAPRMAEAPRVAEPEPAAASRPVPAEPPRPEPALEPA